MLGASAIIATKLRHADGRYTGELESVIDLPMLEAVGHPHAVNPNASCAGRRRHVNGRINKDHESITLASSQAA
jgi:hypothetical protein